MTLNKIQRQATLRRGAFNIRAFSGLLALLTAIVLLWSSAANAQLSGKGEIKGVVTDSTGAVVPGALVTAISTTQGTRLSHTSSNAGDFDLSPLNPDIYRVTVSAKGFETVTQEDVHVNALEVSDLKITLTVGAESQSIDVSTAPPALETSNATLGATMEQEMYAALPIQMGAAGSPDQRRATDFAVLMPGVQGNETNGNLTTNTGVVNGSGSRGAASAVYVNGIPFTSVAGQGDTRFVWTAISVDAVDQFQVQTSGYSALYEGMGVQNYSTKAGGNKIHGALYEYFRNTALDTWGFFAPSLLGPVNPATGLAGPPHKPRENQNEFGGLISGPIIKNKLFLFANLDAYRFAHGPLAAYQTLPTQAEYNGNFNDQGLNVYNPTSTVCNAAGTACTRTQYPGNTIPLSQQSKAAQYLQHFLPAHYTLPTATGNNFVGGYPYGLNNWMTTDRLDWVINSKNTLAVTFAKGRQVTAGGPAVQTTAGRNVTPFAPYNYGQVFAPKTTVWTLQETYVLSPRFVNQFNYGFARYNGPTFNPNQGGDFAATAAGITGLPAGQASDAFPLTNFAGNGSLPTSWAGSVANGSIANAYIASDNFQMALGKHSITVGAQLKWLEYNYNIDATGTSPLTLNTSSSETQGFLCKAVGSTTPATGTCTLANSTTNLDTKTGFSYASLLAGAIDSETLTDNLAIVSTGGRFRPISPYIQDDWKVTSRLTLNLGLRWDYYPTYREQFDRLSYLDPNATNPITGNKGAIGFAGKTATSGSCNCRTNVNDFYKNLGPRLGFAFQSDPKTVWRGSWGVMYTHGNGVGGSAISRNGTGTLGFSASPKPVYNNAINYLPSQQLDAGFPAFAPPPSLVAGYGVGFSTNLAVPSTSPQTASYGDPYLGGRAPQYIGWSFGMQRALTDSITLTMSYVGSEGHFLITDGGNGRGFWINQLDPKYLSLGALLSNKATPANIAAVAAAGVTPQNGYASFDPNQTISTLLKPFPQYGVSDSYANMANANYHGLQISVMKRYTKGLTFMANYTWSRSIDDGGTFRSGYDIPAQYAGDGKFHKIDSIERSVSTSNQPQHVVLTGVYDLPFGKGELGGGNAFSRALLSNFKFSSIIQMFSGSPLALTASSCGTNASNGTCLPSLNPAFTGGSAKINGDWGHGGNTTNLKTMSFINSAAFVTTNSTAAVPLFSNSPRTAPYNLYGPGNYDIDISLRRSFGLHFEGSRLLLQADLYNVTNHTQFGGIGTVFGSSTFGTVSTQANNSRDAQLTARFEF
jgi:Carboxypeptidase regulatory-like domain